MSGMSNDVIEECHYIVMSNVTGMSVMSNDVREECYIKKMMG